MTILPFDHLTPEERLTLIGELWDSLDQRDIPLSDAQRVELERRIAEVDAGTVEMIPWEVVQAKLRARRR
ncbi:MULTISPECIES: addiction module protein [Nitrospirillum]|uniref:Putative addiction module component (TIGR02574 family) n=1 Tax=Nitrospirillum amazonense TaxID=28077 RepID=A0A560FRB9_9PROT|nr:addiction module protein [Nitrospirillum amazonense]MEC4591465.1 addiction module protein [Nitrospirillum amazonense]TWB24188.1 putative addiction module component (TIGR02574 family) [Nitrospirillum amazonense]